MRGGVAPSGRSVVLGGRATEPETIYLANHSLGRPLDRVSADVQEGLGFSYAELDEAGRIVTRNACFRTRVAALIRAPVRGAFFQRRAPDRGCAPS